MAEPVPIIGEMSRLGGQWRQRLLERLGSPRGSGGETELHGWGGLGKPIPWLDRETVPSRSSHLVPAHGIRARLVPFSRIRARLFFVGVCLFVVKVSKRAMSSLEGPACLCASSFAGLRSPGASVGRLYQGGFGTWCSRMAAPALFVGPRICLVVESAGWLLCASTI